MVSILYTFRKGLLGRILAERYHGRAQANEFWH